MTLLLKSTVLLEPRKKAAAFSEDCLHSKLVPHRKKIVPVGTQVQGFSACQAFKYSSFFTKCLLNSIHSQTRTHNPSHTPYSRRQKFSSQQSTPRTNHMVDNTVNIFPANQFGLLPFIRRLRSGQSDLYCSSVSILPCIERSASCWLLKSTSSTPFSGSENQRV